ncbi:MAG TPA: hypothetical protein VN455_05465 [Methanotrichaceae archaeon]|nr:hypothetical protein [Methanotrichaceae archaeon]
MLKKAGWPKNHPVTNSTSRAGQSWKSIDGKNVLCPECLKRGAKVVLRCGSKHVDGKYHPIQGQWMPECPECNYPSGNFGIGIKKPKLPSLPYRNALIRLKQIYRLKEVQCRMIYKELERLDDFIPRPIAEKDALFHNAVLKYTSIPNEDISAMVASVRA